MYLEIIIKIITFFIKTMEITTKQKNQNLDESKFMPGSIKKSFLILFSILKCIFEIIISIYFLLNFGLFHDNYGTSEVSVISSWIFDMMFTLPLIILLLKENRNRKPIFIFLILNIVAIILGFIFGIINVIIIIENGSWKEVKNPLLNQLVIFSIIWTIISFLTLIIMIVYFVDFKTKYYLKKEQIKTQLMIIK